MLSEAIFVSKQAYLIDAGLLLMDFDIVMSDDCRIILILMILSDFKKTMYCKPT